MNKIIKLANNTIDKSDINSLIEWLKTNPQLTKGDITIRFEKEFAKIINTKYAVFVNSGSSANLAIIYSLILSKRLKNNIIIAPAVSWVTTVAPIMQLGLKPVLCDCDPNNLGLNIEHLESLIKTHNPAAIILVHVLGIPNQLAEITHLCKKHDIILIEDCCESLGSKYHAKPVGSFGLASSFSMYYSHQISTIEGGMVCTNDKDIYNLLLSIRCHGWDRDLHSDYQKTLRDMYDIDTFKALYTFYFPGFNLRSTDLQAYIGLCQLNKLDVIIRNRNDNFNLYNRYLKNNFLIMPPYFSYISNMAYPIVSTNIKNIVKALSDNDIESRPLVCGSIGKQPFWTNEYDVCTDCPNADVIHEYGFYVPNYPELTEQEIIQICEIINNS